MNRFILFIAILILTAAIYAQDNPQWLWAASAGGVSMDYSTGIDTDAAGSVYMGGYYDGTANFGTLTLTSAGDYDIFVSKQDSEGNWLWAASAGGDGIDYLYGICADASGNCYVTGQFSGTATFGAHSIISAGSTDIFVAKLSSQGIWLWAQGAGGSGLDSGRGVALDGSGNVYITGSFRMTSFFGADSLASTNNMDIFAAKLDNSGNWLWARGSTGTGFNHAYDIAVDTAGNSYLTGYFTDTAYFGSLYVVSTSYSNRDIVIAKLDTNGNWQWAQRAGGIDFDDGESIAVDDCGNCYVTGYFTGSGNFGGANLTAMGTEDVFISKLDTNGAWQWTKTAGSTTGDKGFGIAADAEGNCYVTGQFTGMCWFGGLYLSGSVVSNVFVCALNSAGTWLWVRSGGSVNNVYGKGIAEYGGNLYVTGHYSTGPVTFGTHLISTYGSYDAFVAKLGAAFVSGIPLAPANLVIVRSGADMLLSWDAVTEDSNGEPVEVDYYEVYYNGDDPYGELSMLGTAQSAGYTHTFGGQVWSGFYNVRAVVED